MNIKPQALKGFRDFLPAEARKRQYVITTFKRVFESYGFEPLETPTLEYEDVLIGKYGDEGDKLMYRFIDNGARKVAMRYDQTVPLARVVAQYENRLPLPFKRYQIQPVWRAENTQKGRFREFVQCDIDTVGTASLFADAEIIATAIASLQALGFLKFKILVNDRQVFSSLVEQGLIAENQLFTVLRAVDKLEKIGQENVLEELIKLGIEKDNATTILTTLENQLPPENIMSLFEFLKMLEVDDSLYQFTPTLARGLDYYTGTIFEVQIEGYTAGSVCGGGRYDELVGMFANKKIPAIGCAFGFDRILEAMDQMDLFPKDLATTQVLVTVFSEELIKESIQATNTLRAAGVNTEMYLEAHDKMEKQLKYADRKGVPYVVIIGPDEASKKRVTVKNLKTREQKTVTLEELVDSLR